MIYSITRQKECKHRKFSFWFSFCTSHKQLVYCSSDKSIYEKKNWHLHANFIMMLLHQGTDFRLLLILNVNQFFSDYFDG